MQWSDIRKLYPNLFVLIENVQEVTISEKKSRVLGGDVITTSNDLKEIMKNYHDCKKSGKNVLFALPNTPEDFVIENVAMMGIMR